jgi:hypothetical protein
MGRRRDRTYEVRYTVVGRTETAALEIVAHDPACALGLLLDELDDDADGDCPELASVSIRCKNSDRCDLNTAVKRAYASALTGGWISR